MARLWSTYFVVVQSVPTRSGRQRERETETERDRDKKKKETETDGVRESESESTRERKLDGTKPAPDMATQRSQK